MSCNISCNILPGDRDLGHLEDAAHTGKVYIAQHAQVRTGASADIDDGRVGGQPQLGAREQPAVPGEPSVRPLGRCF
jgi:hypothetical protein